MDEAKKLMGCIRKELAERHGRSDPHNDDLITDDEVPTLGQVEHTAETFPGCRSLIKNRGGRKQRQVRINTPLWDYGVLYYTFDSATFSDSASRQKVRDSLAGIEAKTCVRFVEKSDSSESPLGYTVLVQGESSGCWSYVGRVISPEQKLNLQSGGCVSTGIIQHEFMHALGLKHEHTRPDRDTYVQINWDHIQEGKEHNFQICTDCPETIDTTPYDYGSVMHYGRTGFSINGSPTIIPLIGNPTIGQRLGLSDLDAELLNSLYCSTTTPGPTTAAPTTAAPTTAAPTTAAPTTAAPTTAAPTTAAPTTAAPTTAAPTTAAPTTAAPTTAAPTTAAPTTAASTTAAPTTTAPTTAAPTTAAPTTAAPTTAAPTTAAPTTAAPTTAAPTTAAPTTAAPTTAASTTAAPTTTAPTTAAPTTAAPTTAAPTTAAPTTAAPTTAAPTTEAPCEYIVQEQNASPRNALSTKQNIGSLEKCAELCCDLGSSCVAFGYHPTNFICVLGNTYQVRTRRRRYYQYYHMKF